MNKEDVLALEEIIAWLFANPRIDQFMFISKMAETFNSIRSSFIYEFDIMCQIHTLSIQDEPEVAISITWTVPFEVATEMKWFLEHQIKER